MEFSPSNPVVRKCLQGMALEEAGKKDEAEKVFLQAWNEASNDFEKYLSAFYVARMQADVSEKLKWLQTTLDLVLKVNDDTVKAAFAPLYNSIADCYAQLNDAENAEKNRHLANSFDSKPTDAGPFFHGTKADLKVGDQLIAGFNSNYQSDLVMNHIYFTALMNGAGLAAALAKGDGRERVYVVAPTGAFENDPNVTNLKFPGNPTRSYRTDAPLQIIGEVDDWTKTTSEQVQHWRDRLAKNTGEIIN